MINQDLSKRPIGIFDSGVGGLTVVRALRKVLPAEDLIYFGDTARYPYGPRSPQIVRKFALQNARLLMGFGIKFLLVACNTASSLAMDELARWIVAPMMGVIEPGAKAAVRATKNKKIGVIGTVGTINSGAYQKALKSLATDVEIFVKPCPLFVPLAEQGFFEGEAVEYFVHYYLDEIVGQGIDTLVLGCTHYPLLVNAIRNVVGSEITIIDSATAVAEEVKNFLAENRLLSNAGEGSVKFMVSDAPERFKEIGERFLGEKIDNIMLITNHT